MITLSRFLYISGGQTSNEDLINAIFSVIDNLERMVNRSEKTNNVQSLLEIYEIQIELAEEIIGKPQYGTMGPGVWDFKVC